MKVKMKEAKHLQERQKYGEEEGEDGGRKREGESPNPDRDDDKI